ncbi:MAG: chemotaxis protein CheC [Oscillospiraceae bacterium]|jgi:chemotaxis protein CheC|nr:chemotaxis protein CheC [Oscillospiraceae bacterium]
MAKSYEDLTDLHFDVLREIGNIGTGNAATSLGMMLGEDVDIMLPKVRLIDFSESIQALGGAENISVGVLVKFSGEASGMIMYLIRLEDAKSIADILLGNESSEAGDEPANDLSELARSAIQEIGNILSSSYIMAISSLTGLSIDISVPYIAIDMSGAILSVPMIEFGTLGDKVLFIEEAFHTKDRKLDGSVIIFMEMDSLKIMMEKLGIEL